jgi:hypothetical protein
MTEEARPSKKSETLEFRLPFDEKARFLGKVGASGQSASATLRALVASYVTQNTDLNQSAKRTFWTKPRLIITSALGAIGLISVPVLADQTLFAAYDLDGNGRITPGEITPEGDREIIEALDTNKNGWVSFLELKPSGQGESFRETRDEVTGQAPKRWLEVSFVTFELSHNRHVSQDLRTGKVEISPDATPEQIEKIRANLKSNMTKASSSH